MDSRDAQHLDGCFLTDEVHLVVKSIPGGYVLPTICFPEWLKY